MIAIYLLGLLRSKGHKVELQEMQDRNSVELWVKGELIYKCQILDLEFGKSSCTRLYWAVKYPEINITKLYFWILIIGGDGLMDPLCSKALEAVEKAF